MPIEEDKVSRHDADDRVRLVAQIELLPDGPRILCVAPRPQFMLQNDDRVGTDALILRVEPAAKQGPDAEHAEQIPGDQGDLEVHAVRSLANGEAGRAVIVEPGDGGERLRRGVHESLERAVRDRHPPRPDDLIDAPQHRQLPLLMHGQGPHEHGIGDAEGRRGGANTDPEGRNPDETERRPLRGPA